MKISGRRPWGFRRPWRTGSKERPINLAAWMDSGDNTDADAMVFNAASVTPQVFRSFYNADVQSGPRPSGMGELVAELRALRDGRKELGWSLCNPFCDRRLARSLLFLGLHIIAIVVALSGLTAAACLWTTCAAGTCDPSLRLEGARGHPGSPCGSSRRTGEELRRLLLSIDIPFFVCVATAYSLAMANALRTSRRCWPVWLTGGVGAVVAAIGSLVVAFSDPHQIWGAKGSVGFAGIWVAVQSVAGIGTVVLGLASGSEEQRVVRSRWSAVRFGLILLGSALALQAIVYLVEIFAASGWHPAVGLFIIFAVTFLIVSSIKQSVRLWVKVPPLACTYMLFWFQAGAYMSFRMFVQGEEFTMLVVVTTTASLSELVLRTGIAVAGKLMYNFHARRNQPGMALRALDIYVATLLVDILAEWAAIAIAGVLGVAVDTSLFEGLRLFATSFDAATAIGLQVAVEVIADVVSLIISFAILPISLEGIFRAPGHGLMEVSCAFASQIFVFSALNARIRIDCFEH